MSTAGSPPGEEDSRERMQNQVNLEDLLDSRMVIDKVSDGITVSDTSGNFVVFNLRIQEITGYSIEDANRSTDFNALLYPNLQERREALARLSGISAQKGYREIQTTIQARDGSEKTLLVSTSLVRYKNRDMFLSVWRDITESKRLARELFRVNGLLMDANARLEEFALKDSHTGLYNHRYLTEALESGFSRAERQDTPLSVIMMDMDYFKSINDVYGHIFGDLILKQFAGQLTKVVRPYDVVIRYGGEEFIIVSADTDRAGARSLALRILNQVSLHSFGDKAHSIKLKLSLAVATYPEDGIRKSAELVAYADRILSKAKESGGNRVYSSLDIGKGAGTIRKFSDLRALKEKIGKLTIRANRSLIEETLAFARAVGAKDHYSGRRADTSAAYAAKISQELRFPDDQVELVKEAALLHDLGKVGIADHILRKKSKLSAEELREIQKHPEIGVDIIRPIQSLHPIMPFLLSHHERWDGTGYPHGLTGERIPLGARIIAIADVYQALVSDRPYRKAYSKMKAVSIIRKASGTQFDPGIVKAFLAVLERE